MIRSLILAFLLPCAFAAAAQPLPDTIEKIKPAIVAVGTFEKTRRPPGVFRGTGFVIGDGLHVVTNAHVLPEKLETEKREYLAIFALIGGRVDIREAVKIAEDRDHDFAVLKIIGQPIATLTLGDVGSPGTELEFAL